ncbi:MAG TPA: 4Fe-4S binding protein [Bacteroidales bacterium]|jgi:NADH-quinone oxidoreductase subunit I|nr:4Fe-4S binding protein [Bacteroidales bacterium]
MKVIIDYIKDILSGLKTLVDGMRLTGSYFVSPGEIVTQKYPENRDVLKMPDRYKGEIIMPHDENNQHRCTGCGICQMNCPNGTIQVITRKEMNAEGKEVRVIDKHIYNLGMCTFCGLCVKTCPSDALDFSREFENAVFDRSKLIKTLNKPGSSLKKAVK